MLPHNSCVASAKLVFLVNELPAPHCPFADPEDLQPPATMKSFSTLPAIWLLAPSLFARLPLPICYMPSLRLGASNPLGSKAASSFANEGSEKIRKHVRFHWQCKTRTLSSRSSSECKFPTRSLGERSRKAIPGMACRTFCPARR